jgi:thiol-disulfide isomerase/thioredoxin
VVKRFQGLGALVLAASGLCVVANPVSALSGDPSRPETPSAQAEATGVDLSGKAVNPLTKAAGKPLVLVYTRSDCPISNRYAPTVKALSQRYNGKAVFMLVYPDKDETAANIKKHQQEYGYELTPLRDPRHVLVKLGKVEIAPEAAVFNGKGELVYHGRIDNWYEDFGRARPAPTTHELDEAVQAALKGTPAPASVGGVGCYISDLQ